MSTMSELDIDFQLEERISTLVEVIMALHARTHIEDNTLHAMCMDVIGCTDKDNKLINERIWPMVRLIEDKDNEVEHIIITAVGE